MAEIKRALLRIWYFKWKNFILVIFFSVLFFIIFLLAILSISSNDQIHKMKKMLGNAILVRKEAIDLDLVESAFNENEIALLVQNSMVDSYNLFSYGEGQLKEISPYVSSEEKYQDYINFVKSKGINTSNNAYLWGVTNSEKSTFFLGAGYNLILGNGITKDDSQKKVAIISRKLAEKNNITVGDSIIISGGSLTYSFDKELKLKVKGIYDYPDQKYVEAYGFKPEQQTANHIFIPYQTLADFDLVHYGCKQIYIYLKSTVYQKEYIQNMKEELGETTVDEAYRCEVKYTYDMDSSWYQTISIPLKEISKASFIMALIITLGIYVILMFVCLWVLKHRKHEFGIYMSIGESKRKIYRQILIEMLLPIILAVIISGVIAAKTVPYISSKIMSSTSNTINTIIDEKREWISLEEYGDPRYYINGDIRQGKFNYFQAPTRIYFQDICFEFMVVVMCGFLVVVLSVGMQVALILHKRPIEILSNGG